MTCVRQAVENAAIDAVNIDDPREFNVLQLAGVAATIWRWHLPADFQNCINPILNGADEA